jgi:small nuclear ribonucleoprotein (snRNP)-like protein
VVVPVVLARLAVKLNANRSVTGNLRGFDQFMNIVLDNSVEEVSETERNDIGLVVSQPSHPPPRGTPTPHPCAVALYGAAGL